MPDYIDGYTTPDNTSYDFVARTGRGLVRATMDNSSTSTAFVVNAPGITSLYDGATFICKNTVAASASGCTLDVNGLGAKEIWTSLQNIRVATTWELDKTYIFTFDYANDRWEMYEGNNTDKNDTYTVRPYYSKPVAGGNGILKYSIIARLEDGTYSSFTTTSGTGVKTFDTTREFDITKLFNQTSSTDYSSGTALPANIFNFCGIGVDMRYSFNGVNSTASKSSLVAEQPLYMIFQPTKNGFGKIVSPYYTQDILTDAQRNVVYVQVGWMRDSYRADLWIENRAFIYWVNPNDNTDIRVLPWIFGTKSCVALGNNSMAFGDGCKALGDYSMAAGGSSEARFDGSFAFGTVAIANNYRATAMGTMVIASSISQHVIGEYNIEDPNATYAEIVGNGTDAARSNARTLDWDGNETIAGNFKSDHHHYVIDKTVDLSKANNDVSSTKYSATYFRDKNDKSAGKIGTNIKANGDVTTEVYAQNFDTSGNSVGYNSVSLTKKKDGTDVVEVSNPQEWAKGVLGGYMRVYKATGNNTQYTVIHTQTVGNTSGYIRRGVVITYQQLVMFTWRGDTATIPTTASLGSGTCTITETNVNNTTFTFNISLSYTSWGGITLILFE